MRVLHSALLRYPSAGILKQMSWEKEAAQGLGLNWDVKVSCPQGSTSESSIVRFSKPITSNRSKLAQVRDWFGVRIEYYLWLKVFESEVDIFILRYSPYDPIQFAFSILCKKPVFLIHHTLEVPELTSSHRPLSKIRVVAERIIGKYSIRNSAAIIGVTQEIIDYEKKRIEQPEKPSILYPNGVMFNGPTASDKRGHIPELLFVSSYFESWHGLDLLFSNMQEHNKEFLLHVVGELSLGDRVLGEKDERIILHGRKSHDEIRLIADSCWLGLSSFALFRKDMKEACTLKVREYLMMGLPVYAGHKDTFPEDFEFYRNSELSIINILHFAVAMRGTSRELVACAAKPYIDKVEMVRSLSNRLLA